MTGTLERLQPISRYVLDDPRPVIERRSNEELDSLPHINPIASIAQVFHDRIERKQK